jgi:hypothetical protein
VLWEYWHLDRSYRWHFSIYKGKMANINPNNTVLRNIVADLHKFCPDPSKSSYKMVEFFYNKKFNMLICLLKIKKTEIFRNSVEIYGISRHWNLYYSAEFSLIPYRIRNSVSTEFRKYPNSKVALESCNFLEFHLHESVLFKLLWRKMLPGYNYPSLNLMQPLWEESFLIKASLDKWRQANPPWAYSIFKGTVPRKSVWDYDLGCYNRSKLRFANSF